VSSRLLQRPLSNGLSALDPRGLNANGDDREARKDAGGKKSPVERDAANQQQATASCGLASVADATYTIRAASPSVGKRPFGVS
jgi:hypothetical protein